MSKGHAIRLPGVLLDELKGQNYNEEDKRYQFTNVKKVQRNGKRKAPLSRKEHRRQERESKKIKRSGNNIQKPSTSLNVESAKKDRQNGSRAVQPSLKREKVKLGIQVKPRQVRFSEFNEVKEISSDDELSSGDFDDFDEDDLNEEEWEQLRELEDSDEEQEDDGGDYDDDEDEEEEEDDDDEEEGSLTAEETMAKLKALKEKKRQGNPPRSEMTVDDARNSSEDDEILYEEYSADDMDDDEEGDSGLKEMSVEETMAALKAMKEEKLQAKSSKSTTTGIVEKGSNKNRKESGKKEKTKSKSEIYSPLTPEDKAAIERDELDMKYYAGKLGLKNGKKLRATDEYDAIGGLLEGLDYFEDFGDDESGEENVEDDSNVSDDGEDELISENDEDEDEQTEDGQIETPFSSDDELSSGDFDEFDEDDLDEDEWQQLRELEGHAPSSARKKQKENIYAAPAIEENKSYVPPSLRKKQLEESDSETNKELKRKVKSALNKLSDSNSAIIVTSLNELYDNYARQYVNDAINNQMIEVVAQKNKLLDTFIMNYAGVAFSIWKLRGTEAGASFIQALVQKFLEIYSEQIQSARNSKSDEPIILSKETTNLLTLLGYSYNFGLVSSRLIYDVIKLLIQEPNEYTTELLLRIISVCGPLIRGDDPRALKDIITELLANVKQMKQTPRLSFLLETLSDLKNNRLKPSVLAANHQPLKKGILGSLRISTSASSEPLLASLEDIKNVDSKGKWWLIGASWKGNQESAFDEANVKENRTIANQTNIKLDDDLLSEMIDWNEIAKQQRMNTDVRRAIFVSIMSAEDYLDAFTKIEKLNLKSKQSLDISRVLLHCLSNDGTSSGYNPYYSLLAGKLSEHNHKLLKSFQFLFWEIVKKLELETHSDDEEDTLFSNEDTVDEDTRLQKLAKQGRFFGHLIAEGHLKLDAFKHVPLMAGLNSDGIIFFDILFFQLFLSEGKAAEIKIKRDGKKTFEYNSDGLSSLIEKGINIQNKNVILKALRWFISKHFDYTKYISGMKGSKEHDRESRRLSWAVASFKKLIEEELKGAED
ncbi:Sgd1 [Kluyveromyces lactis]|nr:Sgd1 [Kluyveromyces lactis]